MLTNLTTILNAVAVSIPPLYNRVPFDAALHAGHGKYIFSSDNDVHFFGDNVDPNG